MRSRMSVLAIVTESDAYSRLPIADCGTWRAPGTRGKVQYGEERSKTRNPAVNASRFSDLRALANFPFKRAVAFGQPFPPLTTFSGA
jgi:hypothetical protein